MIAMAVDEASAATCDRSSPAPDHHDRHPEPENAEDGDVAREREEIADGEKALQRNAEHDDQDEAHREHRHGLAGLADPCRERLAHVSPGIPSSANLHFCIQKSRNVSKMAPFAAIWEFERGILRHAVSKSTPLPYCPPASHSFRRDFDVFHIGTCNGLARLQCWRLSRI